jgi:16S rRNA (guanine527-N7)-methyltransferase
MLSASDEDRRFLEQHAQGVGVRLSPGQIERLLRFLDILEDWSVRCRLVGTRDRPRLITHHIADSLAAAAALRSCQCVMDVGTGAGLPGIPLAIALPATAFTLVDSRRLAVSFLGEVVRTLGLENARVVHERVQDLVAGSEAAYDATISRAWASLGDFLEVSGGALNHRGIAVAMKGPRWNEEISALGSGTPMGFRLVKNLPYHLPGTKTRVLLVFERSHVD